MIFEELDDAKRVLIIKKTDYSTRCYRWRLLKGGLHDGEAETEGLKREILEEIGLRNIRVLDKVFIYEYFFRSVRHTVSSYLVKADSKEPIRLQKSEVAGYLWTTKQEALRMLHWRNEKDALECLR